MDGKAAAYLEQAQHERQQAMKARGEAPLDRRNDPVHRGRADADLSGMAH